jgi:hypothetical protein
MRILVREGRRNGSWEVVLEDEDAGSSKPKVSGCGADVVRWGLVHQNSEWRECNLLR